MVRAPLPLFTGITAVELTLRVVSLVAQLTVTLVTLELPMVPEPLTTVQV